MSLIPSHYKLMATRREVDSSSSEWNLVDFQLQLVTGKSSIKLVSLFKLGDDPVQEQIFKNDAVINVTDFGKEYIEKVKAKTLPLQDLIVYCGHVNIHSQSITNKIFTFLLGRVALGRKGTTKDDVTKLDSILIDNQNDRNSFQYNFFLRSHDQYVIKYEANFAIGEEREFNPTEYRCASCENKQAVLYCKTERLCFCETCSLDHHRTKILQGHEIEKLDKINTLPNCKTHSHRFSSYCTRCEKYLCYMCVQKGGSHASSDHPVYPIQQLYDEKRETNELLAVKQKEKLESLLRSLQLKKDEVNENYTQTKRYIEKQKDKAMQTLEMLMADKSMLLSSDELELKMLNEKLDWSKAFIKFQEKTLKPIHYFHSQDRFEKDLAKSRLGEFESIFSVRGDLAAEGDIVVAKKEVLDRSRNKGPPTSRVEEKSRVSRVSNTLKGQQGSSLYEYNASAELPHRGQLCTLLENSELNFFTLSL